MGQRGIKVGTAVTLLALGGALLVALPLQLTWRRTAERSSLQLLEAFSEQTASTVRRAWWDRVVQAEAAHAVANSLLGPEPDDATARRALSAAFLASAVPSALAYERAAGGRIVARRGAAVAIQFAEETQDSTLPEASPPRWFEASGGISGAAVAYSGKQPGGSAISVYIGFGRFAELVGAIPVGRTGVALVVDPRGTVKVEPAPARAERLIPAIEAAAAVVARRPADAVNIVEMRRIVVDGAAHRVSFSPLEFNGWQFVIILPEAEFLGDIEETQRLTSVAVLALALALGLIGAMLTKRVLSRPMAALASDVSRIERFELEDVAYRPATIKEYDQLSAAIARMAKGLADFGKFIPTDLVRMLLADGVRAAPGGETRELTVMFADVAGFTKLSERMGTAVLDVVSRYLDVVSRTVETTGGTVDKFIGDAVMAFWGAPRGDEQQARNACLAALGAVRAVDAAGIMDDMGRPLKIRIGIHSGPAVVGNIGSTQRLNYTAIGDTVNLASRLEGANKAFATSILVSDETRRAAGEGFLMREVADILVAGRSEAVRVFELLDGPDSGAKPLWAQDYEFALHAYRGREFGPALERLEVVLQQRPDDGPAHWLQSACRRLVAAPPDATWRPTAALDTK